MANLPISGLPAGAAVAPANPFPTVQAGVTVQVTAAQIAAGVAAAYGLALNHTTTTDPTVNDDSGDGYTPGSFWWNSATGRLFVCRVNTLGAAVWTIQRAAGHPGYIPGRTYSFGKDTGATVGSAAILDRIYVTPFMVEERSTWSDVLLRNSGAGAGGNIQIAIYGRDPTNNFPGGAALATTVSISTTVAATKQATLSVPLTFEPSELYFYASNVDAAGAVTFVTNSPSSNAVNLIGVTGAPLTTNNVNGLRYTPQTFGTWPNLTGAAWTEDSTLRTCWVLFLNASVP